MPDEIKTDSRFPDKIVIEHDDGTRTLIDRDSVPVEGTRHVIVAGFRHRGPYDTAVEALDAAIARVASKTNSELEYGGEIYKQRYDDQIKFFFTIQEGEAHGIRIREEHPAVVLTYHTHPHATVARFSTAPARWREGDRQCHSGTMRGALREGDLRGDIHRSCHYGKKKFVVARNKVLVFDPFDRRFPAGRDYATISRAGRVGQGRRNRFELFRRGSPMNPDTDPFPEIPGR